MSTFLFTSETGSSLASSLENDFETSTKMVTGRQRSSTKGELGLTIFSFSIGGTHQSLCREKYLIT